MTTGEMGQGLSAGVGVSIAGKLKKLKYKVFVMIGDGKMQEGQIWEASMCVSKSTYSDLFAEKYPERFFNVGVVEQNEFGIAAGMDSC